MSQIDSSDNKSTCKFHKVHRKYGKSKELITNEKISEINKYLSQEYSIMSIEKMTGISRHYIKKIINGEIIVVNKN